MRDRGKSREAMLLGRLVFLVVHFVTFALDTQAFLRSTIDSVQTSLPPASWSGFQHHKPRATSTSTVRFLQNKENIADENGLKIAVVGAGPSGLLLSHLLLQDSSSSNKGNGKKHKVTLFDGRSDPRTNELGGRAYALGIGIRGRTAIRSVDENLWKAVKSRGYESERFNLHIGLPGNNDVVIPLRSEPKTAEEKSMVEPSLLIYQSELCNALLEELERRPYSDNDNFEMNFDTKVKGCDFDSMTIDVTSSCTRTNNSTRTLGPYDLILGCDGVNSCVRASIDQSFPEFSTTSSRLPGFFKVVRLDGSVGQTTSDGRNPYDPTAVSFLIPSAAFIEPTGADGSCCILFSGRQSRDSNSNGDSNGDSKLPLYLRDGQNATAAVEALREKFPLWREDCLGEIASQLTTQDLASNSAYSVTCNTYHFKNKAALVGDAAHATGGISGQGVNSALIDAAVLAESLQMQVTTGGNENGKPDLANALLEYSCLQLPEGKALYDLSFGPKPKGTKKKLLWAFLNARDALFRGRFGIGELPLQTRLSSDLTSFADIRRERDYFYRDEEDESPSWSYFPSDGEFRMQLRALHNADEGLDSNTG